MSAIKEVSETINHEIKLYKGYVKQCKDEIKDFERSQARMAEYEERLALWRKILKDIGGVEEGE